MSLDQKDTVSPSPIIELCHLISEEKKPDVKAAYQKQLIDTLNTNTYLPHLVSMFCSQINVGKKQSDPVFKIIINALDLAQKNDLKEIFKKISPEGIQKLFTQIDMDTWFLVIKKFGLDLITEMLIEVKNNKEIYGMIFDKFYDVICFTPAEQKIAVDSKEFQEVLSHCDPSQVTFILKGVKDIPYPSVYRDNNESGYYKAYYNDQHDPMRQFRILEFATPAIFEQIFAKIGSCNFAEVLKVQVDCAPVFFKDQFFKAQENYRIHPGAFRNIIVVPSHLTLLKANPHLTDKEKENLKKQFDMTWGLFYKPKDLFIKEPGTCMEWIERFFPAQNILVKQMGNNHLMMAEMMYKINEELDAYLNKYNRPHKQPPSLSVEDVVCYKSRLMSLCGKYCFVLSLRTDLSENPTRDRVQAIDYWMASEAKSYDYMTRLCDVSNRDRVRNDMFEIGSTLLGFASSEKKHQPAQLEHKPHKIRIAAYEYFHTAARAGHEEAIDLLKSFFKSTKPTIKQGPGLFGSIQSSQSIVESKVKQQAVLPLDWNEDRKDYAAPIWTEADEVQFRVLINTVYLDNHVERIRERLSKEDQVKFNTWCVAHDKDNPIAFCERLRDEIDAKEKKDEKVQESPMIDKYSLKEDDKKQIHGILAKLITEFRTQAEEESMLPDNNLKRRTL